MEYLRGQAFEGRRGALPCDAQTRELRQVTPGEVGGVVVEAPEVNHLLQLRLRTGEPTGMVFIDEWDSYIREIGDELNQCFRERFTDEDAKAWRRANPIEGYSEDWVDGDWYQDDDGTIWEWGFDIDRNQHRFFQIDFDICGWPDGRKREKPKL